MVKKEGYLFALDENKCGLCNANCCRGKSGYIWVNKTEINQIAKFLNMDTKDFIRDYLRKIGYKYSLKELKVNGSYDCVFYDEKINGCAVYNVRPWQCRTYPFWEVFKKDFKDLKEECIGILSV